MHDVVARLERQTAQSSKKFKPRVSRVIKALKNTAIFGSGEGTLGTTLAQGDHAAKDGIKDHIAIDIDGTRKERLAATESKSSPAIDDSWSDENIGSIGSGQWSEDDDIGDECRGLQNVSFISSSDESDTDVEAVIIDSGGDIEHDIKKSAGASDNWESPNKQVMTMQTPKMRESLATRIGRNRDAIKWLDMKGQAQGVEGAVALHFERRSSSIRRKQDNEQAKLEKRIAERTESQDCAEDGAGVKARRVVPIRRLISRSEIMRRSNKGSSNSNKSRGKW
mmetsp:Transcript_27468/g.46432  ORF Transcript_27468/g.46432 Transcript_27468/m.46432 type:complete len:280 (-) Transcript_27468:407-1246(-)